MPSAIDTLIGRITDEQLRADVRAAVGDLRKVTDFGLVFERHLPETVRLPHHQIRRGIKVALRDRSDQSMHEVVSVNETTATIRRLRLPDGSTLSPKQAAEVTDERVPLDSLVVLAEFGDPIYPGLTHVASVTRSDDTTSAHVVIKGENHHVLQALKFSHGAKVDCIYIDPPYNSGARDWKYNNNYVDDDDEYRHSKWLAFISRRLELAKELLKPDSSVLIVTIDEKEVHRLVLLLEQHFASARIQVVSTLINPAYVARKGGFGRSDEYVVFVMLGAAAPVRTRLSREWVSAKGRTHTGNIRWDLLRRSGPAAARKDSPGCYYAIYVDPDGPRIQTVGEAIPEGASEPEPVDGCVAVLPIRKNRSEGRWQWTPPTLRQRLAQGRVRVTGNLAKGYTVSILKDGEYEKVLRGEFEVIGHNPDGSLIVSDVETDEVLAVPSTQWRVSSHDATQYGSRLLDLFIPDRKFPFPKSLYAVEDAVRFFVQDKPDAVVLDFFAGSGTTAHAVMRLNHQDGGNRQSISITNNEVSEAEARELRRSGHRPGDPAWEEIGVFEHVTRPRITAAITGLTPKGTAIAGDYKFVDVFPMADGLQQNAEFFELAYLDAAQIEVDRAFAGIAPLLWLRAGGRGRIVSECMDARGHRKPYAWTNSYGVLFNTDRWRSFISKLPSSVTTVYVVTDSITEFSQIAGELPGHLDVVRLYERYLTTFAVNGR